MTLSELYEKLGVLLNDNRLPGEAEVTVDPEAGPVELITGVETGLTNGRIEIRLVSKDLGF